jgi:hypothetical protein
VLDAYDPAGGGRFDADHPVLGAGDEIARTLAYLDQGRLLVSTTARETDVFDAEAGAVPTSFRTDGTWIWTDAVAYYLRTYALCPDAQLTAHIRGRDYTYTEPDAVAAHRAMSVLAALVPR